jgi:hypothetical protein
MIHAKAMAIVVAYDIYIECAQGLLKEEWKLDKPVDFYQFRETLARQMLMYSPRLLKYLGDDKFRDSTVVVKAKRARSQSPANNVHDGDYTTSAGVNAMTLSTNGGAQRLCGFVSKLSDHYDSCMTMEGGKKKLNCVFCGKPSYQFCGLCNKALHKHAQNNGESSCFFLWHDTGAYGMARDDWKITNKKLKDWTYPNHEELKDNERQMKLLSAQVDNTNNSRSNSSSNRSHNSSSNNSGNNSGNNNNGSDDDSQ